MAKTIFCGRASRVKGGPETQWDQRCGAPQQCFLADSATGRPTLTDAFATVTLVNGRWSDPVVWCPANAVPALPMAAIRQHAIRLLPHVRIGVAPPGGNTLVNILTILWADTPADRTLPTATVVGRRVALHIHLAAADWNYGDGSTGSIAGPGVPYDAAAHPCHTAACPGYDGHTYRTTGHRTITLTTRWHAQYSPNGGAAWLDIPGTLSGPTSSTAISVKQARAVLVPNPGDH